MANTAQILGSIKSPRIAEQWLRHYRRLCDERDNLLGRSADKLEAPSTAKLDDLSDAGAEESQMSISLLSAGATKQRISEVLEAMLRIERGGYGTCELTGEEIELERLQAIPWTRYSLKGQMEMEHADLGSRHVLTEIASIAESESPEDEDSE